MPKFKSDSIIIGSRQSDLARIQAMSVAQILKHKIPSLKISFFNRPSFGDLNLDMNLKETHSKGVFTQEFKSLLHDKTCDLVVHSWKDLPIDDDPSTALLSIGPREDQRDLLFLKKNSLGHKQLTVLTSSPRREFALQNSLSALLPFAVSHLKIEAIRGNIPTRFNKFLESTADGFVVAKAAVDRLMATENTDMSAEFKNIREQILAVFEQCHFMVLPLSEFPTAAAQGALAIEILKSNPLLAELQAWSNQEVNGLVMNERKHHKNYGGGCHQAMGFSALKLPFGDVLFTRGTFEGQNFHTQNFKPHKKLTTKFNEWDLFSQSQLESERSKSIYTFEELAKSHSGPLSFYPGDEFVVTRYEAKLESLKAKDYILWVSGQKTWAKLAQEGFWINGSLDGLGVEHKPDLAFLKPNGKYWLTNSSSPEETSGNFKTLSTYDLKYDVQDQDLRQDIETKKCFFWMSGHGFESVLKSNPEIKHKIHFCGLGRTFETLQKHLSPAQIYFCLNEQDFINQTLL